jgi:hypothetical protein
MVERQVLIARVCIDKINGRSNLHSGGISEIPSSKISSLFAMNRNIEGVIKRIVRNRCIIFPSWRTGSVLSAMRVYSPSYLLISIALCRDESCNIAGLKSSNGH